MLFNQPVTAREAIAAIARKEVTPTALTSTELQQLGADWLRNSFFSAQTLIEDLLDSYKEDVLLLLSPQGSALRTGAAEPDLNFAKARENAKTLLEQLGYQPDADKRGTIQDLSGDGRINLVLTTNKQIAQGESWWLQGQDEAILDAFPAQELFRAEARKKERNWPERWRLAGQATDDPIGTGWTITPDGRMIALKNHPIWLRLGDPKLFPDGLGNPFAPFAFGSGMDLRDIARRETQDLGLIDPGEKIVPMSLADLEEAA